MCMGMLDRISQTDGEDMTKQRIYQKIVFLSKLWSFCRRQAGNLSTDRVMYGKNKTGDSDS